MFKPKLFDTLKGYTQVQLTKDLLAGIIVGIVALPLAIAFGIASGVTPEKGLFTAIIAGLVISALGGSRVQIGGPTGAFIVIVYGIVQQYGLNGLIISTFIAGVFLIIMGFARMGAVIKFIPYPLITGFTSGIAIIIFSSQIKDLLGLNMGPVPADFINKWHSYFLNLNSVNYYALAIAASVVLIIIFWNRITHKIPGSLVAIIMATLAVQILHLPVETIGSRFGQISSSFPTPDFPHLDFITIRSLFRPAFTIALLCAIESLLSAVVADGMIGGNHRSNTELIGQGAANICSAIFGGIPATGAIARTATNVKNGGRTPIAGIVHAITLLIIVLIAGRWAALIPMASLAGILVVVAYNMSEWHNFLSISKGPKSDVAILLITFILTVLIDLTVAIEIGMVLAVFLFMRNMIKFSEVNVLNGEFDKESDSGIESINNFSVPKDVEVFEIKGPLFFGAAFKFKEAMRYIEKPQKVFIIRMRYVPIIDATGIRALHDVYKSVSHKGTKFILSEINSSQVYEELDKSQLIAAIGKENNCNTFNDAIARANSILKEGSIKHSHHFTHR